MTDTCLSCAEQFTSIVRGKIDCSGCDFKACKECCKRYMLSKSNDPHCMGCKQKWDRDFLYTNFGRGFINGTYKQHKKELLFEIEKSKIPDTMPRVEQHKEIKEIESRGMDISFKINELFNEIKKLKNERYVGSARVHTLKNTSPTKAREFKHHCPVNECKGFLSKQWKCAVCSTWACSKCHQIVGEHPNTPHDCKQADIESVEIIKKSTKPCPTCHIPIQKSVGCDQMWCTQCHVAFDWKTGAIQNGVIHNPHFFEAKRQGMLRAPGDQVCGGLPNYWHWDEVSKVIMSALPSIMNPKKKLPLTTRDKRQIFEYAESAITYRVAGENVDTIRRLREQLLQNNVAKLDEIRISYIIGSIDEKKYKSLLTANETSREKRQAILDVLEIYNTVTIENFQNLVAEIKSRNFQVVSIPGPVIGVLAPEDQIMVMDIFTKFNTNIRNIIKYTDSRTKVISYQYNQSYMRVDPSGHIVNRPKISIKEYSALCETLVHDNVASDGGGV